MIDWPSILKTLAISIPGVGAVGLVIAYLAKTLIKHALDRDIDSYRDQLQTASTKEIEAFKVSVQAASMREIEELRATLQSAAVLETERLKTALQMTAIEHEVRFSKLHDVRAGVIAEIYRQLVEMHLTAQHFMFGSAEDANEKYQRADQAITEFFSFVEKSTIYLPDDLCKLLRSLIEKVRVPVVRTLISRRQRKGQYQAEDLEALSNTLSQFDEEVPKIRKVIEDEFRLLLGHKRP